MTPESKKRRIVVTADSSTLEDELKEAVAIVNALPEAQVEVHVGPRPRGVSAMMSLAAAAQLPLPYAHLGPMSGRSVGRRDGQSTRNCPGCGADVGKGRPGRHCPTCREKGLNG